LNGRFLNDAFNVSFVSVDATFNSGDTTTTALVNKYANTFRPDLVLITSREQVATLMIPLERALTAARVSLRPYYVCVDGVKTQSLLDAIQNGELPSDIKRRIRGVGPKPDVESESVLQGFLNAYTTRYGALDAPSAVAASYDAVYAMAAAIAASNKLAVNGASVADGLRQLSVGTPRAIGASDVEALLRSAASGSISLRGTHTLMRWAPSGDVLGGTLEVWCIGGSTTSVFGSSGKAMDIQSQVIGGRFIQCQ
jgi:ABC-type branched-subunit amino acid transport system substrate-binding protein